MCNRANGLRTAALMLAWLLMFQFLLAGMPFPGITAAEGEAVGEESEELYNTAVPQIYITPKSGMTKYYGEEDTIIQYDYIPKIDGLVFTGELSRENPDLQEAGQYKITLGTLSAGEQYELILVQSLYTIEQTAAILDFTVTEEASGKIKLCAKAEKAPFGEAPTGTITFKRDDAVVGVVNLAGGEAEISLDPEGGLYNFTAEYSGNNNYKSAVAGIYNYSTEKSHQTPLTFTSEDISGGKIIKTYGDADFFLETTGGTAAVPLEWLTDNPEVASVDGGAVTIHKAGTVIITAVNPGNDEYFSTCSAVVLAVGKSSRADFAISGVPEALCYGDSAFTLTVGGMSGINYFSTDVTVASVASSSGLVTITGAGNVIILAGIEEDERYYPGTTGVALDISPLEITVTPKANQQKEKGEAEPVFLFDWEPELIPGDSFSGSLQREAGEEPGEYSYRLGTLTAGENYVLSLGGANKFRITAETAPQREITAIEITAQPKKLSYNIGDMLDLDGLSITLVYSDFAAELVTAEDFEKYNLTADPADKTILNGEHDNKPVTVSCNDLTAVTDKLTVVGGEPQPKPTVTGIFVHSQPNKLSYSVGDVLSLTGVGVTLTYSDDSEEKLVLADFPLKNITSSPSNGVKLTAAHDNTPIKIIYNNGTFTADTNRLTVKNKPTFSPYLIGISVLTEPEKTSYRVGETLDLRGMSVNLRYSNGWGENVYFENFDSKNIIVAPPHGTRLTGVMSKTPLNITVGGMPGIEIASDCLSVESAAVSGVVKERNSFIKGAVVRLMSGGTNGKIIAETMSDELGGFYFPLVPDGIYSAVVIKGGITVTHRMIIDGEAVTRDLEFPNNQRSTYLEIVGTEAAAANLDNLFELGEKETAFSGKTDMRAKIEKLSQPEETDAIKETIENIKASAYYRLSLAKTSESTQGTVTRSAQPPAGKSVSVTLALPEELKGYGEYKVVRVFEGEGEVLECVFDELINTVTFEADKFSLYSVLVGDTVTYEEGEEEPDTKPAAVKKSSSVVEKSDDKTDEAVDEKSAEKKKADNSEKKTVESGGGGSKNTGGGSAGDSAGASSTGGTPAKEKPSAETSTGTPPKEETSAETSTVTPAKEETSAETSTGTPSKEETSAETSTGTPPKEETATESSIGENTGGGTVADTSAEESGGGGCWGQSDYE